MLCGGAVLLYYEQDKAGRMAQRAVYGYGCADESANRDAGFVHTGCGASFGDTLSEVSVYLRR